VPYRIFADCFSQPISEKKTIKLKTTKKKFDTNIFLKEYLKQDDSRIIIGGDYLNKT